VLLQVPRPDLKGIELSEFRRRKRDNTLEKCKESTYGQQTKFDGSGREDGQLTMTGYGKSPTPAVHNLGLTWQRVDPG
jgi:tRNA U54 and U55 pseudouridine synthase Pus10